MKLPACPACGAPPGAQCRNSLGGPHDVRYARLFRTLARRLEGREGAPSLDGYGLADGLRAAADLLDDKPGPGVHPDCPLGLDTFSPLVSLADYAAGTE